MQLSENTMKERLKTISRYIEYYKEGEYDVHSAYLSIKELVNKR